MNENFIFGSCVLQLYTFFFTCPVSYCTYCICIYCQLIFYLLYNTYIIAISKTKNSLLLTVMRIRILFYLDPLLIWIHFWSGSSFDLDPLLIRILSWSGSSFDSEPLLIRIVFLSGSTFDPDTILIQTLFRGMRNHKNLPRNLSTDYLSIKSVAKPIYIIFNNFINFFFLLGGDEFQ